MIELESQINLWVWIALGHNGMYECGIWWYIYIYIFFFLIFCCYLIYNSKKKLTHNQKISKKKIIFYNVEFKKFGCRVFKKLINLFFWVYCNKADTYPFIAV